jgi:DNA-directed DNA polymerase III PolC
MSPTPPYIELHCHSGYSLLDGASHPEELVLRAKELGYPALALTDHDGLYGAMEFAQYARSEGIQPITGAELTVSGVLNREVEGTPPPHRPDTPADRTHLTVLAETPRGYANLSRLITQARMESPREDPHLPLEALLQRTEGLIVLSGCRKGAVARTLEWEGVAAAEALLRRLRDALGPEHLFVELQDHWIRGDSRRNRTLGTLADRLHLPVVATGNVHYHRKSRARLHDVLTALRYRKTLDASHDVRRPNGLFHLASPEEMQRRFETRPDALASTLRIAQRCAGFDLTKDLGYTFPDFQGSETGKSAGQMLAEVCRAALDDKYPEDPVPPPPVRHPGLAGGARRLDSDAPAAPPSADPAEHAAHLAMDSPLILPNRRPLLTARPDGSRPPHRASGGASAGGRASMASRRKARSRRAEAERRLEQELRLVEAHGLSGFFLVYRDIMEMAKEVALRVRGGAPRAFAGLPPGRGRGSSVSSIICYLIGLSHVDPVEADLFLGRFLNDALKSVPDIDLDFPREIREELILEVYRRYGSDHAGLVCTFPTYKLRSTVREVGKVLELPQGEIEKLAKLVERFSARGIKEEMARIPEFKDKVDRPPWSLLADLAEDIAGLPRHVSQHVGGMIISSRPLVELVPLEPAAMDGRVLCQWEKDSCEDAGFIKIDFLALGMLSLVEEAADLIAERHDTVPDLSRIDFRDQVVFDRICSGDTIGIFQVESRAQIQMIRRVQPRNLRDLAVQVAIVRPGPIVGGAVNPYVRRREMQRSDPGFEVPFDHPLLKDCLAETMGVIIYQDQVLQVCQALAGFTDGQAEGLRRAMSRKRSRDAMNGYWEAFRAGAESRGVDEATAKQVFEQVVAFSEFGFPKSHAHAFGLLAYQSAWLRHYYPTEYNVALFNNQPMGFYGLDALARDVRRNGIDVLLPDVNRSRVECTAEGEDLRVGLGFVRGVGRDQAEGIVEERERNGPFRSLVDFLRRTPSTLKRPAVENLIWVGALEDMGLTRRELLWQTGLFLGPEQEAERPTGRQSDPQLDLALDEPHAGLRFSDLDEGEQMVAEYRMLHFSTDLHPLHLVRGLLHPDTISSGELMDLPQSRTVRLAGLVVARQRPHTAKGYVFVLMEDEYGPINVIVKPDVYEKCRAIVRTEPLIAVRGRLQKDGATLNIIAYEIEGLRVQDTAIQETGNRLPNGRLAPPFSETHAGKAAAAPNPRDLLPAQVHPSGSAPSRGVDPEGRPLQGPASDAGPGPTPDPSPIPAPTPEDQNPLAWLGVDDPDPPGKEPSPFAFLTALRQSPPEVKSFR